MSRYVSRLMIQHGNPPSLDPELCRSRQNKLKTYLAENQLDGALFFDRHYVYTLTGYWHEQPLTPTALWLQTDGDATIFTHEESPDASAADSVVAYAPNRLCTLRENLPACIAEVMNPLIKNVASLGVDHQTPAALVEGPACRDITHDYQHIRRCKDADEITALTFSIECAAKAYAEAKRIIEPGLSEVSLMAAMHETAVNAAGEILSGWGQDFRSGVPGGAARRRSIEDGEIYILDVGVGVRGYRSDLCRAFAVNGSLTDEQSAAYEKIMEAFAIGESFFCPGVSCKEMFAAVESELDGWNGYSFPHHAGHGIGLDPHEVPRINPNWDDTFAEGDVVAIEPGLNADDLKAGIRLENNYQITADGFTNLSQGIPLELV